MTSAQRKNQTEIINCTRCPRLRSYCEEVAREKRRAFQSWEYWGKPVPGFGEWSARFWILGLAPAAHGANRTGRIFTGDQSGFWLYRALHRFGFSNQMSWENRDDGLKLNDTYISCLVRCAPPQNKPTVQEIHSCASYLHEEIKGLKKVRVSLALGDLAYQALWRGLHVEEKRPPRRPAFQHGLEIDLGEGKTLLLSYHPSQQNTFTKRLTEPMFDQIFKRARELIYSS